MITRLEDMNQKPKLIQYEIFKEVRKKKKIMR